MNGEPQLADQVIEHYDGELADNQRSGMGTVYLESGEYEGSFKNGWMDGEGSFSWKDGVEYAGDFLKNEMTGEGTYRWNNGFRYEGQVLNGLRHGQGTFMSKSQTRICTGEWKNSKLNGFGTVVYGVNKAKYEGGFVDNVKCGKGKMIYCSGNIYDGEWAQGTQNGMGRMIWVSRNEEYQGNWKDGKPDGEGEYIWKLQNVTSHEFPFDHKYVGNWVQGARNGFGTFYYGNGAIYAGQWLDNMKHGSGIHLFEDGRIHRGTWVRDRCIDKNIPQYREECPIIFSVPPFYENSSPKAQDKCLIALNEVLLRRTNALKDLYDHYASPPIDSKHRAPSLLRIVSFIEDCKLKHSGLTLAALFRSRAISYKNHPLFSNRYEDPYELDSTISYREFCRLLVHMSFIMHKVKGTPIYNDQDVGAALHHLLTELIFPKLEDSSNKLIDMEKVWKSFGHRLTEVFKKHRCKSPYALPDSPTDVTMTVRGLLQLFSERGLLNNLCTVSQALEIFAKIVPCIKIDEDFDLTFEVIPYEFVQIVTLFGLLKLEPNQNPLAAVEAFVNRVCEALKVPSISKD